MKTAPGFKSTDVYIPPATPTPPVSKYLQFIKKIEQQNFMDTTLLIMKHFIKTELLATEILCHLL